MNYNDGFLEYYLVTACYIIPAIILGTICQKTIYHFQTTYNIHPLLSMIIHLIMLTFVLYVVEMHISVRYGQSWQTITPGLFFVAIFFVLQLSLYDNLDKLVGIKI